MKTLFFPLFLIVFVLLIQALDQSYQKKIGVSKPLPQIPLTDTTGRLPDYRKHPDNAA